MSNKISMDKTYTSNGKPVRLLCVDAPGEYPVVAIVEDRVEIFTDIGRYWAGHGSDHRHNLVEVKPKHDVAFNIYMHGNGGFAAYSYTTREAANEAAGSNRIACVRVEFTEGEGLSNE